jgi:60 kDa SS-A/Ro ribonucleoprotein
LWLTDRDKWLEDAAKRELTPQIDAFERLKRLDLSGDQTAARELVDAGRLPYEVVTGVIKPDVATWVELMKQMPYFAMLRHLNTLQRVGVLAEKRAADYVADKLSNAEYMKKAKVLPFRLFTAYQMFEAVQPNEKLVAEALVQAMDASFVNLPELGETVAIAIDVSGSMIGRISQQGKTRYVDIAGIFAGALLKSNPKALVLPFDTSVNQVRTSARDSLMTTAGKIARLVGGGTALSAPVSHLMAHKIAVDTFIGITDNIEWAVDDRQNYGFLRTWREYKRTVASQAKAFLITIAPYRHAVAPSDEPDVRYIYGWNDQVLSYMAMTMEGLTGQVESVNAMEI